MSIAGGGGIGDRVVDLGPRLKALPLQRQRPQRLPPRLNPVQVGGVFRLEDERPAGMGQGEAQDIRGRWVLRLSRMASTCPASVGSQPSTYARKSTQLAAVRRV